MKAYLSSPFAYYIPIIGLPILMAITYYFHRKFIGYIKLKYLNDWTRIIPKEALPSLQFFRGAKSWIRLNPISKHIDKNYISTLNDRTLLKYYWAVRIAEIVLMLFGLIFFIIPSIASILLHVT